MIHPACPRGVDLIGFHPIAGVVGWGQDLVFAGDPADPSISLLHPNKTEPADLQGVFDAAFDRMGDHISWLRFQEFHYGVFHRQKLVDHRSRLGNYFLKWRGIRSPEKAG